MRKYLEAAELEPGDSFMPSGGKYRTTVVTKPEPFTTPAGRHVVRFDARANGFTGPMAYLPDAVVGLVTRP